MIAGALELQLFADVARIKDDMSKAQSIVGSAMGSMEKQIGAVKTALLGLGGGLSIAALASFIKGAIEGAARLHDLSIQAGISVESLSGLAAVGKATGTGADMIAAASNKLSKALAVSDEKGKGAAAALKALGLSFADINKMTPDQRMQAIAVAMNQFQDGGQKSAAAMLLFGKAGAEMLPFLKDLATAGELHAKITEQQAEAAHQFERSLGRLKTASEAWKKQLAMELLPTLNDIVDALLQLKTVSASTGEETSLVGEAIKVTLQTVAVIGVNVAYVFREIAADFGAMWEQAKAAKNFDWDKFSAIHEQRIKDAQREREEVDKLSTSILGLTNSRAGAGRGSINPPLLGPIPAKPELTGLHVDTEGAKKFDALIRSIKEREAAEELQLKNGRELTDFEKFQEKVRTDLTLATNKFTAAEKAAGFAELAKLASTNLALEQQKQQLKQAGELAKEVFKDDADLAADEAMRNAARGKAAMATYEETRALQQNGEQLALERTLIGATDAQRTIAMENLRVEIKLRNDLEALDREAGLNDEARAKRRAALVGNAATSKQFNEFKVQTDQMSKFWGDTFKGMEDALVAFVTTGKLNFSGLVNSMISDLVRLAVQQYITKPLWDMISGTSLLSLGGILTGTRAIGGTVNAGGSYLVGERGPEIFTAPSSGRITPNDQIGAGGNGGPTIVINNQIGSVASQSDVVQGMQRVRAQIVGELSRSRAYGGTA